MASIDFKASDCLIISSRILEFQISSYIVLPPESVQLFANSIDGCQFDRCSLHHRVWNENPPELRWKRHVVAVCESDLEAEVINQIENWKEQVPAVVIVVLPDIDACSDISLATVMNSTTDSTIGSITEKEGEGKREENERDEEGIPLHFTKSKEGMLMRLMISQHNKEEEQGEEKVRARVWKGYKALCECIRLEGGWVWSQKVFPVEKMKSLDDVGMTMMFIS